MSFVSRVTAVVAGSCLAAGLVLSASPASAQTPNRVETSSTTRALAAAKPTYNEVLKVKLSHGKPGSYKLHQSWSYSNITANMVAKLHLDKRHDKLSLVKPKGTKTRVVASLATYYCVPQDGVAVRSYHWNGKHRLPIFRVVDGSRFELVKLKMKLVQSRG